MVTEDLSSMENSGETVAERSVEGSSPKKKGQGKVPKKIHKAEREKLKRDQLNDLFSDLHNMLETDKQNNGKATILGDTTRILRDLLTQVEALRKENAVLVKESHYVSQENNELRDEKNILQSEVSELQNELRIRSISTTYSYNSPAQHPHRGHNQAAQIPVPVPVQVTIPAVLPVPVSPPRELQLFPAVRREETERSSPVVRAQVRFLDPWNEDSQDRV
ncbi:hypothetical protein LUZ60_006734 [Juncus effusus]|nr:hypothetical protein LUZ60_006734 [Juncus effusus]